MTREIDIPEYQYNNIMAFDSVNLGRVPYKGIIMYAINAIKRSKALEQTKNDLGVEYISRSELMAILSDYYDTTVEYRSMLKEIAALPPVIPQEPKTGYWTYIRNSEVNGLKIVECSECGKRTYGSGNYCPNCGAKMEEGEG